MVNSFVETLLHFFVSLYQTITYWYVEVRVRHQDSRILEMNERLMVVYEAVCLRIQQSESPDLKDIDQLQKAVNAVVAISDVPGGENRPNQKECARYARLRLKASSVAQDISICRTVAAG